MLRNHFVIKACDKRNSKCVTLLPDNKQKQTNIKEGKMSQV